jgi:hypothetical protein
MLKNTMGDNQLVCRLLKAVFQDRTDLYCLSPIATSSPLCSPFSGHFCTQQSKTLCTASIWHGAISTSIPDISNNTFPGCCKPVPHNLCGLCCHLKVSEEWWLGYTSKHKDESPGF